MVSNHMQIVHVVRQFHPSIGGLEAVVRELAMAQHAKGHDVRIVTLDRIFNAPHAHRLPHFEKMDGLEIVRIPYFGFKRYPIAFSAIRHIRDADIVHVHGIDFFFDYLAWTAPLHRRKLVVSTHGGFFHTGFAARLKRLYFNTVTRLSLSWYAGVAAVSVADHQLFGQIRHQGICLIENGVDVDKFSDASSHTPKKTLLSIGRLSSNKRLDSVIHFLAALCRLDPQWSLRIAGRPWDVSPAELRNLAQRDGLSDKVEIIDTPPDKKIREVMGDCSAFVSASSYEGFGLVAVEALSAGLVPVVSPIPPFQHLVDKTGVGTVVDFDDVDAAARTFLADWTKLSAHYNSNRRSAMTAASAFRWPAVSEKYQAFYDSVLGKNVRSILDVPVRVDTSSEAIEFLDRHFDRGPQEIVVFANANTLNAAAADERVHSILDHAIVFNDGIGVDIASRLLFGTSFPENLNGTDFLPNYLKHTKNRYRIFLLGSKPGIVDRAADRMSKLMPQHKIVGTCHGYIPPEQMEAVVAQIRRSRADILLVGMGNPAQEHWLNDHLKDTGCRLGFGVGALLDFLADVVPRAPQWVRSARAEWAYRLMQEPMRLWRRYLVEMPIFLFRVFQQWAMGSRVATATLQ
jgi:alpha-1,3-mannosyltransferase